MSKQKILVNKLAREELVEMVPYQSARRLFSSADNEANNNVWLNANEAPGTGDYQVEGSCINRYPDFQPDNLMTAYSEYSNLKKEQLLATRGADEGIELVIKTFCQAYQDKILICPPTYGMYSISAQGQGVGIIESPMVNNALNMDEIRSVAEQVKVVFLCSPGNPTGNLLPEAQIIEALDIFNDTAIVVVDEAYIEFSPDNSMQKLINQYDNLVVLRTLSKAFGLAGLRCGFVLSNREIITMMSKVIAPYPIAAPVAEIAAKALSGNGIKAMQSGVDKLNYLKQTFIAWLESQEWCLKVFQSDANFVLFECQNKDFIFDLLKTHNILIRDQSKQAQLTNCLRISIGSENELTLVQNTITAALPQSMPVTSKV